ncbi:uncharacterized protein LOC133321712 [Musca vetustissima]|uniref:uncharacterized protein LOC133321712 n=1 Tax=Musca vetustissima TaxID=27455 RepID=UPI002AB7A829|nr:uncharacterized protein LOC133321712 [Musca vetustissima]
MFGKEKLTYKSLGIFLLLLVDCCSASSFNDFPLNGTSIISKLERQPKLNIVSFEPLGEHLALGLDFLLPFIKIPITREDNVYGTEPALININSAALITTGILAGSGALISYLFRKYVLIDPMFKSEKSERSDNDNFESELWSMLENVKVIYRNSSGEKVDTSLTGLLTTIDESFSEKGINLNDCLQMVLCHRLQKSNNNYEEHGENYPSSGVDKIIDGLTSMKWIRQNILPYTPLNDIIGDQDGKLECNMKFPKCKWSMTGENLCGLFENYIKFT